MIIHTALTESVRYDTTPTPLTGHGAMEIQVGSIVELMGVENAGLDITGQRGTVTEMPASGLVSVAIEGSGAVVSSWPENLKIISSAPLADRRHDSA